MKGLPGKPFVRSIFKCEYNINGKWSAFQAEVMGSNPFVRKGVCTFLSLQQVVFSFLLNYPCLKWIRLLFFLNFFG